MPIELSRRKFLGQAFLAGAEAVGAGVGAVPAAVSRVILDWGESPELVQYSERVLRHSAEEMLDEFLNASGNFIFTYYQNFFPIFYGNPIENFRRLESLCSEKLRRAFNNPHEEAQGLGLPEMQLLEAIKKRPHRCRVLPALAAIHSVPFVESGLHGELLDCALKTLRTASDPQSGDPNGEVVEIIWQTFAAALLNPRSWKTLRLGRDLLKEAELVCHRFLDRYPELLLAAVACWQFLLTYEVVLASQADDAARSDLTMVSEIKGRLELEKQKEGKTRFAWLDKFQEIHASCVDQGIMVNQILELALQRPLPETAPPLREAADFAVLCRLEINGLLYRVAQGEMVSPYRKASRSADLVGEQPKLIQESGVSGKDWPTLKAMGLLSNKSVDYWQTRPELKEVVPAKVGQSLSVPAVGLISLVDTTAETATSWHYEANSEKFAKELRDAHGNAEKIRSILQAVALDAAEHSVRGVNAGFDKKAIEDKLEPFFNRPSFKPALAWLEEESDKEKAKFIITVTIDKPAEAILPGQGEERPAGERKKLSKPEKRSISPNSKDLSDNPSDPRPLLPLGQLIALRREVARIRFKDKLQENKGLGILTLGEHGIRLYSDGSVGLLSSAQFELLHRRGIEFTPLETEPV